MCETVWTVCYVKNLHKLFMCEWNGEIWIIIVGFLMNKFEHIKQIEQIFE